MVKSLSPWIFRQETPRRLPTDAVVGSLRAEVEFLCPEDGGLGNGGVKINELYIRLGGGFKYFWHFHLLLILFLFCLKFVLFLFLFVFDKIVS